MKTAPNRPARTRGRPSLYRPEYAKLAKNYCEMGAIDDQLAHFFEVSVRSVRSWRVRYPEFAQACQLGKEVADERVEASLFSRAVGYSFDSEKILTSAGQIFREAFVAHIPPDVKACVIWLTNRRPAEWRVNPAREANGSDGVDLDAEMRADAPRLVADEPSPANPIM